jgi:hypothetical protein
MPASSSTRRARRQESSQSAAPCRPAAWAARRARCTSRLAPPKGNSSLTVGNAGGAGGDLIAMRPGLKAGWRSRPAHTRPDAHHQASLWRLRFARTLQRRPAAAAKQPPVPHHTRPAPPPPTPPITHTQHAQYPHPARAPSMLPGCRSAWIRLSRIIMCSMVRAPSRASSLLWGAPGPLRRGWGETRACASACERQGAAGGTACATGCNWGEMQGTRRGALLRPGATAVDQGPQARWLLRHAKRQPPSEASTAQHAQRAPHRAT